MKNLHRKIEAQKKSIHSKKEHIKRSYNYIKHQISSPAATLMTIGGLAIGFLLIPNKYKLIKNIFKIYTMAATARQVIDLIPSTKSPKSTHTTTTHSKKSPSNVVKMRK